MKKGMMLSMILLLVLTSSLVFASGSQEETAKEIELTWPCIWVATDSKADSIAAIVDEFNELHKGEIKVVIEPQPDYDGYEDTIRTRFAAKQVPDIFTFKLTPTTLAYFKGDQLLDFTSDLDAGWDGVFNKANLEAVKMDGSIKAIPYEIAITPIWYNTELFAEAGIAEFPKTFDEFWMVLDKLKAAGITPTSQMTGGSNSWTSMLWYSHLLGSFGGPDVWERGWDDPAYEQAAAIMKRLYTEGNTTSDAIGADAGVSGGHYQAARTAMFINGPWYIGNIKKNSPDVYAATKLTAAPQAGDYYGHQVGWLHTVIGAANTDDPARRAAVVEFLQFLTLPENAKAVSLAAGSLLAVDFELGANDTVDPLQAEFIKQANNASFLLGHMEANRSSDVVYELGQALGSMVLEDKTPAEFVQQLADAE